MHEAPYKNHSFAVTWSYLDKILTKIEGLNCRPCRDAQIERIESNICNLSRSLLNQLEDYQRRQIEVLKEDAGPPEDQRLSMQQLGVSPR